MGLAVSVVACIAAISADSAVACNEPLLDKGGSVSPSQAGPHDPVTVYIPNTLDGAQYTVSVRGIGVVSGTDPDRDPGVAVTFVMPDLGGENISQVEVHAAVTHEDADDGRPWESSRFIAYIAPQPAPPPPPEQPANEAPAPSPGASAETPAQPVRGDRPPAPAVSRGPAVRRVDESSRARTPGVNRTPTRPRPAVRVHAPAAAAMEPAAAAPVVAPEARVRPPRAAARAEAVAKPPSVRTAEATTRSPWAQLTVPSMLDRPPAPDTPRSPLLLLATAAAAVVAIGLLLLRRPREADADRAASERPPAPRAPTLRDLAVEAELQELIAEHRARLLLGSEGTAHGPPGGRRTAADAQDTMRSRSGCSATNSP